MSWQTSDGLTHVELIWVENRIEHWIRFGREVGEQILDRRGAFSASRRTASSPTSAGLRTTSARSYHASISCAP